MENKIDVQLVLNENNRLNDLIPMFKSMSSQNYGKIDGDFFIIGSHLTIKHNNKNEFAFAMIQRNAQVRGIPIVCYSLKIKNDEKT